MALFRPSRDRSGPDRYLQVKMILFALGAAVGLVGIFTDRRLWVAIAIGILVIGWLLRFLPRESNH